MSTGTDAADAVLQPARTQDSDSHSGEQAERHVEVQRETPAATVIRTQDVTPFAYIWQLFGYSILDVRGRMVGPVARVWTDGASSGLAYVGLTTGRLRRRTHVIPAGDVHIDDRVRSVTVPYRAATIRGAPHHNTDVPLSRTQQRLVDTYYDHS